MTAAYNPAEIDRLATWARGIVRAVTPLPSDEIAVTMHANLSAMADQLEAAADLRSRLDERIRHLAHVGDCKVCGDRAQDLHDVVYGDRSNSETEAVRTERDAARTEADQLRAALAEATVQRDAHWREATEAAEQRDVYRERSQQLAARVADLEAKNATASGVIATHSAAQEMDGRRICELEMALREARNWIADRSSPESILVGRIDQTIDGHPPGPVNRCPRCQAVLTTGNDQAALLAAMAEHGRTCDGS